MTSFVPILLVLGLSGLIGQIVLLREFLTAASGNELSIGVFLGSWLLLGAAGCLHVLDDRGPTWAPWRCALARLQRTTAGSTPR